MTRLRLVSLQFLRTGLGKLIALLVVAGGLGALSLQLSGEPTDADSAAKLVAERPAAASLPAGAASAEQFGAGQASVSDFPSGLPRPQASPVVLEGRLALLMNLLLIERGHARLQAIPDYTAIFTKQERVDGELSDPQTVRLKLRHEPFSVYMKWMTGDRGREVIYVEGENDGKMLVHLGGWKARLLPTVKLDPHGPTAMAHSRHPITDAGLLEVARRSIAYRQRDLAATAGVRCRMLDRQVVDDRECYCFIIEYDHPGLSDGYRKVVAHIDQEYSLPVSVKNYGWPETDAELSGAELDAQTLIEVYSYTNIRLRPQLAEAAFSRANTQYRFR